MNAELCLTNGKGHVHCYDCGRLGGEGVLLQEGLGHSSSPPSHPYSFLIGEDGLVYEGRGWNTVGAHSGPTWNPLSLGISFMGNYMSK